jgi:hypothetical protein
METAIMTAEIRKSIELSADNKSDYAEKGKSRKTTSWTGL